MATIQFKQGIEADIPTLKIGEPGWAIDTNKLYIGGSSGNQAITGGGGGSGSAASHDMTGACHILSGETSALVGLLTGTSIGLVRSSANPGQSDRILRTSDAGSVAIYNLAVDIISFFGASVYDGSQNLGEPGQFMKRGIGGGGIGTASWIEVVPSDVKADGSQYDLMGMTSASTFGVLKPSSNPAGASQVILKTDANGNINLQSGLTINESGSIIGTRQLTIDGASGVVINEDGDDENFRIESANDENAFVIDAGADRAGFGVLSPQAAVHIVNTETTTVPERGLFIDNTFAPTSAPGSVFPIALNLLTQYDSTQDAGGFALAQFLDVRNVDSGTQNARLLDIVYRNQGAGTVNDVRHINIRTPGNSGGGAIQQAYGIYVQDQNAATINWSIYTEAGEVYHGDNVLIGTTTKPTGTEGKVLTFGDNTGNPTMGTDTAGIFAKDVSGTVEMFAIGEDDVATQLSSHDPITKEWIHHSVNQKTGKALKIDMERLMRRLDEEFGGGFIHEFTISE